MNDERFFTSLAAVTDAARRAPGRAPARAKSRVYSALVTAQASEGPLLDLTATWSAGHGLCVFETLLRLVPAGERVRPNPCRTCHARVLAERLEAAPIYWPHCPYVTFQNR